AATGHHSILSSKLQATSCKQKKADRVCTQIRFLLEAFSLQLVAQRECSAPLPAHTQPGLHTSAVAPGDAACPRQGPAESAPRYRPLNTPSTARVDKAVPAGSAAARVRAG